MSLTIQLALKKGLPLQNVVSVMRFISQYFETDYLTPGLLRILDYASKNEMHEVINLIVQNEHLMENMNFGASREGFCELKRFLLSQDHYEVMNLDQKLGLTDSCESCSICLGEFEIGQDVCQFPCGHMNHSE